MPPGFHLAQLNIAQARYPLDDERMAGFMNRLDEINAVADVAPGFVWRLQTDDGNATALRPFPEDDLLVNLSVWESIEALREYVYRSQHLEPMRQRQSWFHKMDQPHMVLWWVPAGHIPTLEEAKERLAKLRVEGPTPEAFTFKHTFEAGDAAM